MEKYYTNFIKERYEQGFAVIINKLALVLDNVASKGKAKVVQK